MQRRTVAESTVKKTFQSMEKRSFMVDVFHSQYVDGSKQTFFTQSQGRFINTPKCFLCL